jgi:putative two-component system response regulator
MRSPSHPVVLVVDDEPEIVQVLGNLLRPEHRVRVATDGAGALRVAASEPRPDLILLDRRLPDMDGYEVMKRLQDRPATADIPIVFVTGVTEGHEEGRGLELGAADYITKPLHPAVVRARVGTHLQAKRAREGLRDQNALLEAEVARRMRENDLTQTVGIRALAHLAEMRDTDTGAHIMRTQGFVRELARLLSGHPRFEAVLDARTVDLLVRSAPLHDIGKVGIPDRILLKPGPLDEDERAEMETHAALGADALARAEADVDEPVAFMAVAKQIARWHHERWDGSGYPDGLAGEEIPVPARLMALADVFDALISPRVYKPAMAFDDAREVVREGRGRHFDPDVSDVFLEHFATFVAIAGSYPDERDAGRSSPLIRDGRAAPS